jgi:hypothetical protein
MAELIREAAESVVKDAPDVVDPLDGLVGVVDRGPVDMAERHDEYLTARLRRGRANARR